MIPLLAWGLAYAGFVSLARAMDRHHRQVWHHGVSIRLRALLRLAGMVGLGLSLAVCIVHLGGSVSIVLWLLTVAALAVALMLTYRPRLLGGTGVANRKRQ